MLSDTRASRCAILMGKTWVRGASTQTPKSKPEAPTKQKRVARVWTRDPSNTGQAPDSSDKRATDHRPPQPSPLGHARGPQSLDKETSETASGLAAKRRRLSAQGRYIGEPGNQQQSTAEPAGPSAASNGQVEQPAAKSAEAEKKEKLQREAEALRRKIAEEEAKLLAAKVQCYSSSRKPESAVPEAQILSLASSKAISTCVTASAKAAREYTE